MDLIIFLFVGAICFPAGMKILSSEERNKVFNRYHIEVEDVKKYNKACGWLVIGFGVVAELTMLCAYALGGRRADIVPRKYHSGLVQYPSHSGADPGGNNCHENLWDNREENVKKRLKSVIKRCRRT